ncbi:hypothetical protein C0Q70_01512 [Pomacea canaliculata]|uniref:Uncharacterized protein n=1 Tax=Pomacea canaliculata TaxID=400727 RepID=A0A2T7PZS2_POMCA|nr:hypothetical protein C0Q70_01512 [Pomacea canaliculata]
MRTETTETTEIFAGYELCKLVDLSLLASQTETVGEPELYCFEDFEAAEAEEDNCAHLPSSSLNVVDSIASLGPSSPFSSAGRHGIGFLVQMVYAGVGSVKMPLGPRRTLRRRY